MSRIITYEMLHAICHPHEITLYVISDNYQRAAFHMVHIVCSKKGKKLDHCLRGDDVLSLFEMMYRYLETGGFILSPGNEVDPSENKLLETKEAPSGLSAFL